MTPSGESTLAQAAVLPSKDEVDDLGDSAEERQSTNRYADESDLPPPPPCVCPQSGAPESETKKRACAAAD